MAHERPEVYDVFLAHSERDQVLVEKVHKSLREQGLIPYAYYQTGGQAGKPVYDCSVELIKKSKMTLVVMTENAIRSHWVRFEVLVAVEESYRRQTSCLKLLFAGVSEEERARLMADSLRSVPEECCIAVDVNTADWAAGLREKVMETISLTELLPLGNIGHGLVYSYFIGYLSKILKDELLKTHIKDSEWYKSSQGRMSTKFHVILPESCRPTSLETPSDHDGVRIERKGAIELSMPHGGKIRSYRVTVYSLTKGQTEFFFVGEIPAVIRPISDLNDLGLEEVTVGVKFQIVRFYKTLYELLHHHSNGLPRHAVSLLTYDDATEQLADKLMAALETEFNARNTELPARVEGGGDREGRHDVSPGVALPAPHSDTVVICGVTNEGLGGRVLNYLADNGVGARIVSRFKFVELEGTRWSIIVLSPTNIADGAVKRQYESLFAQSVENNRVEVICLYHNMSIREIPDYLKCSVILNADNDSFLPVLLETIKGAEVKLTETLSAGDVATGLAWSYIQNYLRIQSFALTDTGHDLQGRFRQWMEQHLRDSQCQFIPKCLLLFPKSCQARPGTETFPGEEYLSALEPVYQGQRPYNLHAYRTTLTSGESVVYSREYSTPSITLGDMANFYRFAGLSRDAMYTQQQQLAAKVNDILSRSDVKEKIGDMSRNFEIVYYDDEKETERTALEGALRRLMQLQ